MKIHLSFPRFDNHLALIEAHDIAKRLSAENPDNVDLRRLSDLLYKAGEAFKLEEVTEWKSTSGESEI